MLHSTTTTTSNSTPHTIVDPNHRSSRDESSHLTTASTTHSADLRERRRKIVHMLPGFIPAIVATFYHDDPLPIWNLAVVATAVATLLWLAIRGSGDCRRMDRESWTRTCLTYTLPPMVVLCLFPANLEYAFVVLTVLAFGDSAAAIGGRRFGKRTLPWNREKTWAGLLCFLILATPIAILVFWGEARPRVTIGSAVLCGMIPAALGALAETLPSRIDDNLRVCAAAAIGVVITGELFVQLA